MYEDRIRHKIVETEERLDRVRNNLPDTFESFNFMSPLERDGIYKNVEFIIQNIIDICYMLVKKLELGIPEDIPDVLDRLAKNNIFSKDRITTIREMKGFRNILVHKYGEIDDRKAFDNISSGLKNIKTVLRGIEELLDEQEETQQ